MFIGDVMFLTNPSNVSAETDGEGLILTVKNDTAWQTVEKNLKDIRSAASELAGRPVPLRMLDPDGNVRDRFAATQDLINKYGF